MTDLAWITGARGFLGRAVARRLAAAGWSVAGLGHGAWTPAEARAEGLAVWREATVDTAGLDALLTLTSAPRLVVHAAGGSAIAPSIQDPLLDFNKTVGSTAELLDFLRRHAPCARVLLTSSVAVCGCQPAVPISEERLPAPTSPYGTHKAMAEMLGRGYRGQFGLDVAAIRFFSIYGPGLRKQILWDLTQRLTCRPAFVELGGTGTETRDMIHVEDAAALVAVLAAASDLPDTVNGGSGCAISIRDLAEGLAARLSPGTTIRFSGQRRPGDPPHFLADTTRAKALGFVCRWTLEKGLDDYADWIRRETRRDSLRVNHAI